MIALMENMSVLIGVGIFVIVLVYFYPLLSSILLGEKKMGPGTELKLDEMIENKKRLMGLSASAPTSESNVELLLLQEAQWGSGTEISKIYQTLIKYHYQCELTDISLSIKHFFQNEQLKKTYTNLVPIESLITTHLCLFLLSYKKSNIGAQLCKSLGINEIMADDFKTATCQFLQISQELSEDRAGLSQDLYQKLAKNSEWKELSVPLKEILKMLEQNK